MDITKQHAATQDRTCATEQKEANITHTN